MITFFLMKTCQNCRVKCNTKKSGKTAFCREQKTSVHNNKHVKKAK